MRKLTTITAAAALVAAFISLPIATAEADGAEAVILKCVEGFSFDPFVGPGLSTTIPQVLLLDAPGSILEEAAIECATNLLLNENGSSCRQCLTRLWGLGCEGGTGVTGGVLVNFTPRLEVVADDDIVNIFLVAGLTLSEFVLACDDG